MTFFSTAQPRGVGFLDNKSNYSIDVIAIKGVHSVKEKPS
jgi:hypothetical protein